MQPTTLLLAVALLSLVTVELGGWALLGFITTRNGTLGKVGERFWRAGASDRAAEARWAPR
ncbi:MAG: hypothetical protein ACRDZ2_00410 [Ilumatobacteraceae bacterium]